MVFTHDETRHPHPHPPDALPLRPRQTGLYGYRPGGHRDGVLHREGALRSFVRSPSSHLSIHLSIHIYISIYRSPHTQTTSHVCFIVLGKGKKEKKIKEKKRKLLGIANDDQTTAPRHRPTRGSFIRGKSRSWARTCSIWRRFCRGSRAI